MPARPGDPATRRAPEAPWRKPLAVSGTRPAAPAVAATGPATVAVTGPATGAAGEEAEDFTPYLRHDAP